MKCTVLICLAIWGQSIFLQTCDLSVIITNFKSTEGGIQIGLYNTKGSFPLVDKQYRLLYIDTIKLPGIYTLKDLPAGEYAVAIFHDENSDKICNTNFLGIPKEGYGFSKNFKPRLSSPSFDDCKIDLKRSMSVSIKLIY